MASRPDPRVFFDTNVLFSGLHSRHGVPNRLLEAALDARITPVISATVLAELVRNLNRKAPRLIAQLTQFLVNAPPEVVPEAPVEERQRWSDAGLGTDAPIVAAALASGVDYFCTGDARLLEKARAGALPGLNVVSPGELLDALERDAG
jgi:putative PIN family toxin of toxin-antitoxin system